MSTPEKEGQAPAPVEKEEPAPVPKAEPDKDSPESDLVGMGGAGAVVGGLIGGAGGAALGGMLGLTGGVVRGGDKKKRRGWY